MFGYRRYRHPFPAESTSSCAVQDRCPPTIGVHQHEILLNSSAPAGKYSPHDLHIPAYCDTLAKRGRTAFGFGVMTQAIHPPSRHHRHIYRHCHHGDLGAPIKTRKHAQLTVEAALELVRKMDEVNLWLTQKGFECVKGVEPIEPIHRQKIGMVR